MKHPEEAVALQAIEFWSAVCDEEQELAIEAADVSSRVHDRRNSTDRLGRRVRRNSRGRVAKLCKDCPSRDLARLPRAPVPTGRGCR